MAENIYRYGSGSGTKAKLQRLVNGCLRSAIEAHGPITCENHGSAGKRIANQITAELAPLFDRNAELASELQTIANRAMQCLGNRPTPVPPTEER